jgi:hypothetical protein
MMKTKLLLPTMLIIANSVFFESCLWASPQNSFNNKNSVDLPITQDSLVKLLDSIAWNETTHTFEGGVPTGPPATFKFIFTNYSNHPIKVKGVDAACSCTATDFTRNEIPPGSSGWIQAAYKTENTFGYFKKYVDVTFEGSPNKHRLYLTGSVDPYKK